MTWSHAVEERYALDEPPAPGAVRGTDRKLDRHVVLWTVEGRDPPAREALLALARGCSRLAHPLFLKVLDVADAPARLAVVLQSPGEATLEQQAGSLPTLVAVSLTLEVATALQDARRVGLEPRQLPLRYLHFDPEGVRIDPLGVFAATPRGAAANGAEPDAAATPAVSLLCDLLEELLGRTEGAPDRFDPGRGAARSLVARWRERAAAQPADDGALPAFVSELRVLLGRWEGRAAAEPAADVAPGAATAAAPQPRPAAAATPEAPTVRLRRPPESALRARREARGGASGWRRLLPPPFRGGEPTAPAATATTTLALPGAAPARRGRADAGGARVGVRPLLVVLATLVFGGAVLLAVSPAARDTLRAHVPALPAITLGGEGNGGGAGGSGGSQRAVATAPAPAAGKVTVSVVAQEPTVVRVTVDGAQAYSGTLRAGQGGSWQGTQRVEVWTDHGKTLQITINGYALGAYSPAMGHPDWNHIDYGFGPGWKP